MQYDITVYEDSLCSGTIEVPDNDGSAFDTWLLYDDGRVAFGLYHGNDYLPMAEAVREEVQRQVELRTPELRPFGRTSHKF